MRMAGGEEGSNRKRAIVAAIVVARRRRLLPAQPRARQHRPPAAARRRLEHARRLDLPARRRLRLRRDRRLRRPRRAGRDGDAARRRRRRAGGDRHLPADRDRLVLRPGSGDTTSFFIGRRLGRDFVLRNGPRFGISNERFEQVEDYFDRHGGKTIFIGRFISLVRAFAPFIAGSSGMRYRAFVPYSILGTGLWASAHILLGYFFSRSIDSAAKYAGKGRLRCSATLIVVVVGIVVVVRPPAGRGEPARGGALDGGATPRPAGWCGWRAASARSSRFLWDRVTPGGTFGLEFTTLMATLAVALFVLVAYTVIVSGDPGPTPGDLTAFDFVERAPGRLAGPPRQGRHRARLPGRRPPARRALRGAARPAAGAGPSSACWSPGWR